MSPTTTTGIINPWADEVTLPAKPLRPIVKNPNIVDPWGDDTLTLNGRTPLRDWLLTELETLFPKGSLRVIRSDLNPGEFHDWTGSYHETLRASWDRRDKMRADIKALEAEGYAAAVTNDMRRIAGATLTTCNSFLGTVANRICEAGGISGPRLLKSFDLPAAGSGKNGNNAWHWWPDAQGATPKPGDFFQLGTKGGFYWHVGIIYDIDLAAGTWSRVESGQGGPTSGFDAIKRNGPTAFPPTPVPGEKYKPFMGWIDIDQFFQGWNRERGTVNV